MDYNGSFTGLIVRDGLDVCGGNVFKSLIAVLCMNEYTPGSDTNMFESALTRSKILRIVCPLVSVVFLN